MAKGVADKRGNRKVAINFPEKLFRKINERAKRSGASFSDVAIDLAKCGLLDVEESEALEPTREGVPCP